MKKSLTQKLSIEGFVINVIKQIIKQIMNKYKSPIESLREVLEVYVV